LLQDVQVQGPFEFSPDGSKLLFASPRNGNFDIYVATLDAAGKDALKTLSSQTDLSPALAAAGHPAGLSTSGQPAQSGQPAPASASNASAAIGQQPALQPAAAPATSGESTGTGILPAGISPYIAALAGLAVVWAAVEAVVIARRRTRRRGTGSDGQ